MHIKDYCCSKVRCYLNTPAPCYCDILIIVCAGASHAHSQLIPTPKVLIQTLEMLSSPSSLSLLTIFQTFHALLPLV
uniref:Uncharacterized protein n=1 Tax=Octopus bimaculoides TaxID=37653 RepID=A0A0L8G5C1_OCTBM